MDNKTILKNIRLIVSLMELHEENPFKIKPYRDATFAAERNNDNWASLSESELLAAFGKKVAQSITELIQTGTCTDLQSLLQKTPEGVTALLKIKGLGAKKVRALWLEHKVETVEQLADVCQTGQLAKFKGFGEKTQQSILEALVFIQENKGKLHYSDALPLAEQLLHLLQECPQTQQADFTGSVRRQDEVISVIEILVATSSSEILEEALNQYPHLQSTPQLSSPWAWRGVWQETGVLVAVYLCKPNDYIKQQLLLTGAAAHLSKPLASGQTFMQWIRKRETFATEQAAYEQAELPYIVPAMREGRQEWEWSEQFSVTELVEYQDLKGVLHNHSTYSDGADSLAEMAAYAKAQGFEYLGISDHSKTAFYANGLTEERVLAQLKEIDQLNAQVAPFRIFKGIESDILTDGSLDYAPDILAQFDFVVASVHSVLNMDEAKATQRLLKAIENPYTTILGHPTGRLLLRREGYPIDHQKIIDACAANGVMIEVNANPWRLDLDWRWIGYAMQKGIQICINPDAHQKERYDDMRYGVLAAQKGGLVKSFTFNTLGVEQVAAYFETRKKK